MLPIIGTRCIFMTVKYTRFVFNFIILCDFLSVFTNVLFFSERPKEMYSSQQRTPK